MPTKRNIHFLLVLDIDHFKAVNDTYGHTIGDEVLKVVSDRLKGGLRNVDMLARFGGEEFVAVMPDSGSRVAMMVAERLRRAIADTPFVTAGLSIEIAISAGVAHLAASDTPQSLLDRADGALYEAKARGRNQVVEAVTQDMDVRAAG